MVTGWEPSFEVNFFFCRRYNVQSARVVWCIMMAVYKLSFGLPTDVQLWFLAGRLQRHERLGGVEQRQFEPQRNVRQGVWDVHEGSDRRQAAEEQLGRGRCCRSRGRSLGGGRRERLLVDQLARQQQLSDVSGAGIAADRPSARRQVLQEVEFRVRVAHQPVVQLSRDRKSKRSGGAHQSLLGMNFTRATSVINKIMYMYVYKEISIYMYVYRVLYTLEKDLLLYYVYGNIYFYLLFLLILINSLESI